MGKVAPRPPRPPLHDPTGGPTRPAPEYVYVHSCESDREDDWPPKDFHWDMCGEFDAPVRPPQPQTAPTRASETAPRREPPPPPPKDQYVPSRSRRKPEVLPKMYGTSSVSDKRGPLQTLYEDALNDVWGLVSTCFVLWWEAGGAALATLGVGYPIAWLVSLGNIPRSETPPFDFRLWPFIIAVFAALLVSLLYCLPQMLKRQDAVSQRRIQHAVLVAERRSDATT